MSSVKRIQLTLFVPAAFSTGIEAIRAQHNPAQFALIASHVTLCREDELLDLDAVIKQLETLKHAPISLGFGAATRFEEGKGLCLPAQTEQAAYENLRAAVLGKQKAALRKPAAHITLIHPRNGSCNEEIFDQILQIPLPNAIRFDKISLIAQENGQQWQILREFLLQS